MLLHTLRTLGRDARRSRPQAQLAACYQNYRDCAIDSGARMRQLADLYCALVPSTMCVLANESRLTSQYHVQCVSGSLTAVLTLQPSVRVSVRAPR